MAATCRAANEVVEPRIPVRPAQAAVTREDLPASLASTAIIRPEDLAADQAEPVYQQVAKGLAQDRISGMVLHVGTPLSVQVGSALHRRPDLFSVSGWPLSS